MEKYVSWILIDDAIKRFTWFLQDVQDDTDQPEEMYHIIFGCGTVVLVSLTDKEFAGYDGSYMEEWPLERIETLTRRNSTITGATGNPGNPMAQHSQHTSQKTIDEIFSDCKTEWSVQSCLLDEIDPGASKAIKCAYETFIRDGFPRPGASSRRVCVPMENADYNDPNENTDPATPSSRGLLWGVMWERNYKIYNLAIGGETSRDADEIIAIGGELRRLDFMFPSVYAVITPQLKTYVLGT